MFLNLLDVCVYYLINANLLIGCSSREKCDNVLSMLFDGYCSDFEEAESSSSHHECRFHDEVSECEEKKGHEMISQFYKDWKKIFQGMYSFENKRHEN